MVIFWRHIDGLGVLVVVGGGGSYIHIHRES